LSQENSLIVPKLLELKKLHNTNTQLNVPIKYQKPIERDIAKLERNFHTESEILDNLKRFNELKKLYAVNNKLNIPSQYQKSLEKDITNLGLKIRTALYTKVNVECIKRDIRATRELTDGKWPLFINIMYAAWWYDDQVLAACEAWVDGIVSGAWIPSSLPELTKHYPDIALIPILSSVKWVNTLINQWGRAWKIPDAIILEDPSTAWGHLWANKREMAHINDSETTLAVSIPGVVELLKKKGLKITIVWAWGIKSAEDIRAVLALGADAVQIGTLFATSKESGFKKEIINLILSATKEDIIEYMSSAGLPARALKKSTIFEAIKNIEAKIHTCNTDCLKHCGLKMGTEWLAQMCILSALVAALEWSELKNWLGFVGTSAIKIKISKKSKEIMEDLTQGYKAA